MECLLCVRHCLMPFVYNVLNPFDNSAKQAFFKIIFIIIFIIITDRKRGKHRSGIVQGGA